jgi:predicted ABC-type exoprotein transport system permease subunit
MILGNYLAVFLIFPMLAIPFAALWLCFKPEWLQTIKYLPSNRLFLVLYAAVAWIICVFIIIMGYDWDHQVTISEQLMSGVGCLAFSFGFILVFRQQIIKEK